MVNQELVNYFKEGINLGNPTNVLERTLIDAGWPQEEVELAQEFIQSEKINSEDKKNYSLGVGSLGKKNVPFGIVLVSILHWLFTLGWLYVFIFNGTIFSNFFEEFVGEYAFFLNLSLGLIIAALPLIVGLGIWKGINVWRVVSIVFSAIFVLISILVIIDEGKYAIMLLIASLYILFYLSFNHKAREYFHKKN